ncbi:hypothetical protein [Hymenobacter cheonanensis]|uniref:hypothetical protein n=1 Tax=Hymenobacter sp. CA2-7 TaxID=3063993 RepID=UPI002713EC31|nr:hypothetical protein [Hymenobacter sp. CA2-7]MDO7884253.1 hypothetical protein [Hymenobacter sp. CA2-7]
MMLRLLSPSVLTALLLVSALGCTKKDDPAPTPAVGTGSYKVTRDAISGQARAFLSANVNSTKVDVLSISLTDTPTLQSNTRTVNVFFQKPTGQPSTAYQLTEIVYYPNNTNPLDMLTFASSTATLKETSSGVFSGTFSGTTASSIVLSEGIFTDARLN